MSRLYNRVLFLFVFAVAQHFSFYSSGQGCSDAGFCTMGAMKPNQRMHTTNVKLRSVELTEYYGDRSELKVNYLNHILDLNFGIGKNTLVQTKFVYVNVLGVLGNVNGTGDVSLSMTRKLYQNNLFQWSGTLGAKIPTNNANGFVGNLPLPMYYQTSLGTYDAVAGISVVSKYLLLATGIQHPFNMVANTFTWGAWKNSELSNEANIYPVSNKLIRGTDMMFRVEANTNYHRFNGNIGFLMIHRLNRDQIIDPKTSNRVDVPGSDGNANTLLMGVAYKLSAKALLKLAFGHRLTKRALNPDGLSRDNVATLTINYLF